MFVNVSTAESVTRNWFIGHQELLFAVAPNVLCRVYCMFVLGRFDDYELIWCGFPKFLTFLNATNASRVNRCFPVVETLHQHVAGEPSVDPHALSAGQHELGPCGVQDQVC